MSLDIYELHTDPSKLKGYESESYQIYDHLKHLVNMMKHSASYEMYSDEGLTFDNLINAHPKLKNKIIKIIASSADLSYYYAATTLLSEFPLGEKAISTNAQYSYKYAKDVLGDRFKLGEPVMMDDSYYNDHYTYNILRPNGYNVKGFNA